MCHFLNSDGTGFEQVQRFEWLHEAPGEESLEEGIVRAGVPGRQGGLVPGGVPHEDGGIRVEGLRLQKPELGLSDDLAVDDSQRGLGADVFGVLSAGRRVVEANHKVVAVDLQAEVGVFERTGAGDDAALVEHSRVFPVGQQLVVDEILVQLVLFEERIPFDECVDLDAFDCIAHEGGWIVL